MTDPSLPDGIIDPGIGGCTETCPGFKRWAEACSDAEAMGDEARLDKLEREGPETCECRP